MQQARNSLQKAQQRIGITAYMSNDAVKAQIEKAIGRNSDQFVTSIISAVNANPQLQECTNASILSAALVGQSLKLSPSPQLGQYYFVPYKNNRTGTTEAQFQIGYRGMYQLAIRSGQFKKLNALAIKEGELVNFNPLEEEIEINLIEDEEVRENAETIGYYGFFELINGFRKAIYWPKKKMEKHAERYSAGYRAHKGYTFWEKDFDAMACKTIYRQLLKLAPMSIDMQKAMVDDMAVIREDGSRDYVDGLETDEVPQLADPDKADTEPKQEAQKPAETQAGNEPDLFG